MSYKYDKLLGRIKEMCGTQENLAKRMGMNPVTMCVKLKNRSCFKQNEIAEMCAILSIPTCEIGVYFFCFDN